MNQIQWFSFSSSRKLVGRARGRVKYIVNSYNSRYRLGAKVGLSWLTVGDFDSIVEAKQAAEEHLEGVPGNAQKP